MALRPDQARGILPLVIEEGALRPGNWREMVEEVDELLRDAGRIGQTVCIERDGQGMPVRLGLRGRTA